MKIVSSTVSSTLTVKDNVLYQFTSKSFYTSTCIFIWTSERFVLRDWEFMCIITNCTNSKMSVKHPAINFISRWTQIRRWINQDTRWFFDWFLRLLEYSRKDNRRYLKWRKEDFIKNTILTLSKWRWNVLLSDIFSIHCNNKNSFRRY